MSFYPPRAAGLLIGMTMLGVLLAADAACLAMVSVLPIGPTTFFLILFPLITLPAIGFIAYRLFGLATARYRLDRNALRLEWGLRVEVLPIAEVERVRPGIEVQGELLPAGLWWPGCVVGRADVAGVGPVEFFAASDPSRMVVISAGDEHFAISPGDPEAFLRAYRDEDQMGALERVPRESRRASPRLREVWADNTARLLIFAGLLLGLGLLASLTTLYPDLPGAVPLHFDSAGQVDRTGPAARLLILPVIGGTAWTLNALLGLFAFRRDRLASYWLWGAAVAVQLLTWLAAFQLIGSMK